MAGLSISPIVTKINRSFFTAPSVLRYTLLFLVFTGIVIILPGPTYYIGFVVAVFILAIFTTRHIPLSLFFLYLLSFYYESPLITFEPTRLQAYFNFIKPMLLPYQTDLLIRHVMLLLLIMSLILYQHTHHNLSLPRSTHLLTVFITSMVALLILKQPLTTRPIASSLHLLKLLSALALFPVTLLLFNKHPQLVTRLIIGFTISSLIVLGSISVGQYITQGRLGLRIEHPEANPQIFHTPEQHYFRSPGTLSAPNFLATNIAMLLPILFTFFFISSHRHSSILPLAAAVLGVVAFILNLSRWAWITFPVAIVITLCIFRHRPWVEARMTHLFSVTRTKVIILLASTVMITLLTIRFHQVTTLDVRLDIAQRSVTLMQAYPLLGTGPGLGAYLIPSVIPDYQQYHASLKSAHNTLLNLAVENGLPVTFLFIIFCYFILRRLLHPHQSADWITLGLTTSIITFLLNALAYPLYIYDPSLELFMLLSGLLVIRSTLAPSSGRSVSV